jgi:hypothetical protein
MTILVVEHLPLASAVEEAAGRVIVRRRLGVRVV